MSLQWKKSFFPWLSVLKVNNPVKFCAGSHHTVLCYGDKQLRSTSYCDDWAVDFFLEKSPVISPVCSCFLHFSKGHSHRCYLTKLNGIYCYTISKACTASKIVGWYRSWCLNMAMCNVHILILLFLLFLFFLFKNPVFKQKHNLKHLTL